MQIIRMRRDWTQKWYKDEWGREKDECEKEWRVKNGFHWLEGAAK